MCYLNNNLCDNFNDMTTINLQRKIDIDTETKTIEKIKT